MLYISATVFALILISYAVRWAVQPSPASAAGLLEHADSLAWNNQWVQATPLYLAAEKQFRAEGDLSNALYAHVSQVSLRMENSDLSHLINELAIDLKRPEAQSSRVQLRILEMKAKCEEEYDAGIAKVTFAQVEELAYHQGKLYLASRASGEQGILAFTLGDTTEASRRVKRSYAVAKYLGDPAAHVRYAEMIGMGIAHMGRPKQAMQFLDEAISAQKEHPEVVRPTIAYAVKIDALSQLGREREGLALADEAIDFPRKNHLYGQLQSLLTSRSEILSELGKENEAISGFQEALGYARTIGSWRAISYTDGKLAGSFEKSGQYPQALAAIDEAISANQQVPEEMFLVPENLSIKARIKWKMGFPKEAENLYINGMEVLDVMLAHVPTSETEQLLLTELSDLYSGYFDLLASDGRCADAFTVIEKAHGRIEAQELEYDHTEVPHAATPDESRLNAMEVALLKRVGSQNHEAFAREIRSSQTSSVSKPRETTATLAQVQSRLKANELLIEYVLSTPESFALAITDSTVKRHVLPSKTLIETAATEYVHTLRTQHTNIKLGRQLFTDLLGFVAEYPKATSFIVVPDGNLHLLPFSALVEENGKYLVEDKPDSIASSGTVLWLLRNHAPESAGMLPYLGVAAFTDAIDSRPWVLKAADAQTTKLLPLPESRNEVESIGAMMPKPSKILLGQQATKATFKALPLGSYRIVHLALHGYVDPVFPDRSAVVFAPVGNDNGRLEARDIRQLHLHADLVTLSACDTGVGPVGPSGVESVVAAFVQAGASSVVETLWELEDHASNRFMKAFYTQLRMVSKAEALRQAKLDSLHSGLPPYYWASYEIVGDSDGPLFPPQ